jgi:hypothetical protein
LLSKWGWEKPVLRGKWVWHKEYGHKNALFRALIEGSIIACDTDCGPLKFIAAFTQGCALRRYASWHQSMSGKLRCISRRQSPVWPQTCLKHLSNTFIRALSSDTGLLPSSSLSYPGVRFTLCSDGFLTLPPFSLEGLPQ